jgi:hypothetical protein
MSGDLNEALSGVVRIRCVPNWISRLFDLLVADFKLVDCGSLDVLVWCVDELAVGSPGDRRLPRPVDAP